MEHDETTRAIARFTASVDDTVLTDAVARAVTEHHLDSIACALGGFSQDACRMVREIAETAATPGGVTTYGIASPVAVEQAVFANSTMLRQLDLNDSHLGGGHPSDLIPAIYAATELTDGSGRDFVRGAYVGYEVFAGLADRYPPSQAGYDGGALIAVAAAMGVGSVFGLNLEALENAVAMALAPGLAMRFTRHGALSQWKACAAANSASIGTLVARLAYRGLTGPAAPFEDKDGLHRHIAPTRDLIFGAARNGQCAVERTMFKYYPSQINTQGLIEPLAGVRDRFSPADVTGIAVETYQRAYITSGGGENDHDERWNPTSRETADHSMPFIIATTIVDGDVSLASYAPDRLADPTIRRLMAATTITPVEEFTALYPGDSKSRVTITLSDGRQIVVDSVVPVGDIRNPMTPEHLHHKFRRGAEGVLSDEQADTLERQLWEIAELERLDQLSALLRVVGIQW